MMKLSTRITETRQTLVSRSACAPGEIHQRNSPIRTEMTGVINITPRFISKINQAEFKITAELFRQ